MALKTYRSGVWHALASLKVFRSGSWRQLKTLKVWDGSAWRQIGRFIEPLTLSVSPNPVVETSGGSPTTQTVSGTATATPAGGLGPFTYAWAHVSGDTMTITNGATATATFSKTLAGGASASGVFAVTGTDAAGQTATVNVPVGLFN
jgi:hypothetical protein